MKVRVLSSARTGGFVRNPLFFSPTSSSCIAPLENNKMKTDPQNKAERFWNRTANNYEREEKKDGKIFLQIIEKTKKYLKPTDTVLDFGCGTGLASSELSGVVKNIHAIDFSSKMIAIAKRKAQRQNIQYIHTSIFDDKLEAGLYDVILSFHVLHLLEDTRLVIKRMQTLLKPGGLLISVTPCMGETPFLSSLFSIFSRFGIVPQIKSFKQNELGKLLTMGRFEIMENVLLPGTSNQYFVVSVMR